MQNSISIHTVTIHFMFLSVMSGIPIRKSGLTDFPASVAQLFGQFVNHVFKYYTVYVLTQQVYQEPVPDVTFADHLERREKM